MLAIVLALVGVIAIGWALMWDLRRATFNEAHVEEELRHPGMLSYAVPDGQDPAVLSAALAGSGYRSVGVLRDGVERLLVDCPSQDGRAEVRSIIEHVRRTGFDGDEMRVAHVTFDDEIVG